MRRIAGFSLVELMCAILILGVALVGLTQGITAALSASKDSEVQTTAALIAAGRIETLQAEGFILEGVTEGSTGAGLSLYDWTETISPTDIEGLYEVAVVVENSKTGRSIYELRTLLFDPPIAADETAEPDKKTDNRQRKGAAPR